MIFGFEFVVAKQVRAERKSQVHNDGSEKVAESEGFGQSIRDLPVALKLLLCNPTNMFVTMAGVTQGIVVSGFTTFMPKFIQSQFGVSAGTAALLGGRFSCYIFCYYLAVLVIALYDHAGLCYLTSEAQPLMADP